MDSFFFHQKEAILVHKIEQCAPSFNLQKLQIFFPFKKGPEEQGEDILAQALRLKHFGVWCVIVVVKNSLDPLELLLMRMSSVKN